MLGLVKTRFGHVLHIHCFMSLLKRFIMFLCLISFRKSVQKPVTFLSAKSLSISEIVIFLLFNMESLIGGANSFLILSSWIISWIFLWWLNISLLLWGRTSKSLMWSLKTILSALPCNLFIMLFVCLEHYFSIIISVFSRSLYSYKDT